MAARVVIVVEKWRGRQEAVAGLGGGIKGRRKIQIDAVLEVRRDSTRVTGCDGLLRTTRPRCTVVWINQET